MTAEELLMSDEVEVFQYSNVIEIDGQSRHVNVPIGEDMFGVEGDKNVTLKHFTCPKIVGNNIEIDLSEHNLYANYTLADEKGNPKSEDVIQSPCENIVIGDDNITFDWKISEWVTKEDGYIAFSIVAKKSVDGVLETRWYTTPAVGKVLKTVKEGRYIEQQYPDVIDNLMNRVSDLERILANGGGTGGSITVDDALSETSTNPVQNKVVTKEIRRLSEEIADLTGGSLVEPKEDDIPKVFIDGEIPTSKTDVLAELTYVSNTDNFHAYLEIKCQGDSSLSYPKKNFTIKMFSDNARETKLKKEFKGWGEHNKFVLKANYIDHSHARNIVSAKLWGQIVASRSDYNSLPTGLKTSPNNGAIEGFPVKVYNNGTYQGIYTWNIPKDDWLYGVDEDNPNQFVLYGQKNTDGVYAETATNFRKLWDGVSQSDREWEVEVGTNSDIVKTALNNVISLCMNADDVTFKNTLGNYLDVQSALDYYIFVYTICALDSLAQNMILVSYDGTKLYCSAYDLDSTFGLWWNGQSFVSTSYRCPEDYQERYSLLWERIEKLYADELKERYVELRNSVLSLSNMFTQFERFMDIIGLDLYAEDLTVYTGIPSGSTNNIKQIRNYIRDRLIYCDAEFEAMNGETEPDIPEETIPATGITLNQTSLSFTNGTPITLTATVVPSDTTDKVTWSSDDTSIATVIGGVVTPISNGSCTITATAGSVSATCSISISGLAKKIWSDTKTNRIDKTTGIAYTTGGDAYVSEYIEVADDVSSVTLQNTNGGQFKWKELYAYDSNKAYLGKVVTGNGGDGGTTTASTITKELFPDMAYVRSTATGDTEPNSKLEFVFE